MFFQFAEEVEDPSDDSIMDENGNNKFCNKHTSLIDDVYVKSYCVEMSPGKHMELQFQRQEKLIPETIHSSIHVVVSHPLANDTRSTVAPVPDRPMDLRLSKLSPAMQGSVLS